MKNLPKIDAEVKDESVTIKSFDVNMFPSPEGQLVLFIHGLGDDGLIYKYDGAHKRWLHQA